MTIRDPLTMLVTGLAVGLAGSFTDDLFGGSMPIAILQVALWIACAALVIPALLSLRHRGGARGHATGRAPGARPV
jgi:hypothetical protein